MKAPPPLLPTAASNPVPLQAQTLSKSCARNSGVSSYILPSIEKNPKPKASVSPEQIQLNARHLYDMLCCCICIPKFKCALATAIVELLIGLCYWWEAFNDVAKNRENIQIKDVALLLFITSFIIASSTALGTFIAGRIKKQPHYLWPRLVLLGGVLVTCAVLIIFVVFYFFGGSHKFNSLVIDIMEFLCNQEFSKEERQALHSDLVWTAIIFTLLLFLFTGYTLFGFLVTRQYYRDLLREFGDRTFQPVSQSELHPTPTAPPKLDP